MPTEITPERLEECEVEFALLADKGLMKASLAGFDLCTALREAREREAALTTQVQSLQAQLWRQGNKPVFIDSWRNSDGS